MTQSGSKPLLKYSYIRNFFRDFLLSLKVVSDNLSSIDDRVKTSYMAKADQNSINGQTNFNQKYLESEYHEKIGIGISSFLNDFNKLK
jgi:hypothetical protein